MVVGAFVYSFLCYLSLLVVFFSPLVFSSLSPVPNRLNISSISLLIVVGFMAFRHCFAYCVKALIRATRKSQEPLKPPLLAISLTSINWLSDIERFILLRSLIIAANQNRVYQFPPWLCKRKYQSPRCYVYSLVHW